MRRGQYIHSSLRPSPHSFVTSPTIQPSFHSHNSSAAAGGPGAGGRHANSTTEAAAHAAVAAVDGSDPLAGNVDTNAARLHIFQVRLGPL